MIHFNFTVSNEDAESIFTILNNQISRNREEMLKLVAYGSLAYNMLEAYKRDNEYIKALINKMTNTKVEE
jgi:ketol-acid reductoisomerase